MPMDRLEQLRTWVQSLHPDRAWELAPASADASFRRYFRLSFANGETRILMDAPPSHEDCRPFLHVAHLFRDAGAHVPTVHAQDLEQGFLELSDLGNATYLSALGDGADAHSLYADALGALAAIQRASQPGLLPQCRCQVDLS